MNRLLQSVFWVLLILVSLPAVLAQEGGWPRTLPLDEGMVTIYPLQVDEMNGDILHFRAALAYRATADSEPVFGAAWFESRVEIDRSSRIVRLIDLKVTQTRFPAGTDDVQAELSAAFAQQSPTWNLDFSLDELEVALETAEAKSKAVQELNTAPPRIVYRDHPALLISMDGEPVLREVENSPYKAVINTPYPLIFDGKQYYLNAAKGVWYRAGKATGPYQFEADPPADIAAMVNADEAGADNEQPAEPVTAANAPEIVVSTEPAELIVTEGPAAFVPLVDDLLVLQNSDNDVFMHVSSQAFYIVLAGRWYHSGSLNGPWAYRPADELPAAFANIPRDSDQADSRVYVAGTEEARDAVLDAQVPQTAAVERGEVDIEVEYDGEPVYKPVDGTDLVYIRNTGSTVIQSNGMYYLVEDGVWYVSSSPKGPWQVSDHRPAQVDTILPSSPVYNVKYVRVYDSTPSVVYVGYTPGYTGSYVYYNTIVYGSGWYYPPWVSPYYYYPRYSTWGFNVSYNPWYGWNFGLSWGWGPFSAGYYTGGYWHRSHYWNHRYYGYWGPGGYRPRPALYGRHGYGRDRYAHGNDGRGSNGHGRGGYGSGGHQRNSNLYRGGSQRARIVETRDNQPRIPNSRVRDTRLAGNTVARGSRERDYSGQNRAGQNKAVRNTTDPIRHSDLRFKAVVRDVNNEASQRRLLADNSGNVHSGANRGEDRVRDRNTNRSTNYGPNRNTSRNGIISRSDLSAKGTNSRTTPVPRINRPDVNRTVRSKSREEPVRSYDNRTQPVRSREISSSPRQSQTRLAYQRDRQQTSPAVNAPVQRPQARISSGSVRQQSRQMASAPTPRQNNSRQNSSRPSSPPRSSRNSSRSYSAPAQRATQRSSHRTGSQRSGSASGGRRARNH